MTEYEQTPDRSRSMAQASKPGKPTSGPLAHPVRQPADHPLRIRSLSDRLVKAQKPLRVLDAIHWDASVEASFFAAGCRNQPPVTRDYYQGRPLAFEPKAKLDELKQIERDVRRELGEGDPAGCILTRMCREYQDVVLLLQHRGTRRFAEISGRLYGSARSLGCQDGGERVAPCFAPFADADGPAMDAAKASHTLAMRLRRYFGERAAVRVKVSGELAADAAAGCGYIKLRSGARFTPRQLRLLEVHEGWVHLGTALNGLEQPVCTFLSKGAPSSVLTQEGLAVLTELLASASYPERWRRLWGRLEGVAMAEAGAAFRDVYRFFLDQGSDPRECYQHTMRIFRGSLPDGCGPFTKDVSYGKGFLYLRDCLQGASAARQRELIELLFCGKTSLGDLPMLERLRDLGLLSPPRFVPPYSRDLNLPARMATATIASVEAP